MTVIGYISIIGTTSFLSCIPVFPPSPILPYLPHKLPRSLVKHEPVHLVANPHNDTPYFNVAGGTAYEGYVVDEGEVKIHTVGGTTGGDSELVTSVVTRGNGRDTRTGG